MTGLKVIADIRRHRGDSNYVIELVSRYCSGVAGAEPRWLVRPDQSHLFAPDQLIGQADPLDRKWIVRIRDLIAQSAKNTQNGDSGGPFWVLSYDNNVLAELRALESESLHVNKLHIAQLHKANGTYGSGSSLSSRGVVTMRFAAPRGSKSLSLVETASATETIPIEEAIKLAKQVLVEGGHTSAETAMPQKDLRPRMVYKDPRAAKRWGDPASDSLISTVVDDGLQNGWLKRFKTVEGKTGTEAVYIVEQQNATGGRNSETSASGVIQERRSVGDSATVSAVATSEAADRSITAKKHPTKATHFEHVLSEARIGALPETRILLFDAVESVCQEAEKGSLTVAHLFARAGERAKEAAITSAYEAEKNWPIAQRCVARLMLWSGVILDGDGQPVRDRIGVNNKIVGDLKPDFRKCCEAFLVEFLAAKCNGLNYDDDQYYLGLVLYRRGKERAVAPEELKAKADALLEFLENSGRIRMDDDRVIRVTSPGAI